MEEKKHQQFSGGSTTEYFGGTQNSAAPNSGGMFPGQKIFPTPGDIFAMLGIALGAQVVVAVCCAIVLLFMGVDEDLLLHDPVVRGKFAAVVYFCSMSLTLLGVLLYRNQRGGRGPIAHFSSRGLNPVLLLWGFVLVMAVSVVMEPVVSLLPAPSDESMGRGLWTVVAISVFAPLFEEVLCRGVILGSLRAKYGVVTALLVSSLFFGILHLQPAQVVGTLPIGLVLGYIYIVTRSLWAPIILHALNNALAYVLLAAGYQDQVLSDLVSRGTYLVIYILALVVTALSVYMIQKSLRRMEAEEKNRAEA